MELYIYCTEIGEINTDYHHVKNKEIIKKILDLGEIPESIKILNNVPEMNFCETVTHPYRPEVVWLPVQLLLTDLIDDNSSINNYYSSMGDIEKKTDIFLNIWEQLMQNRFGPQPKEHLFKYDVWYTDPLADELGALGGENKGPTFLISIPHELVEKYYPDPVCYISSLKGEGYQQFFDLHKLDKEEFTKYVAPYYYNNLSQWYSEKLRDNAVLRATWIGNLFAGLH